MASIKQLNDRISSSKFQHPREDLLSLMPEGIERVLEVGCGTGGTADGLRKRGVKEITGIEVNPWAAEKAKAKFDKVIIGDVDRVSQQLEKDYFDLILYGDVLEHLIDPWKTLASHKRLIKSNGFVLLSVPNVRHWRTVYNLVIRGKWSYQNEGGTLDKSHLRFFTRNEIIQMVKESGFTIRSENHNEFSRRVEKIDRLSVGIFRDFLSWQIFILAQSID